jgi:Carboxypeptidase regulatory-like domain
MQVWCLFFLICHSSPAHEKTTANKPRSVGAATEARESTNSSAAKLPVRRVVLYKNGVGYFEHLGHVRGSQDVHIDFTSAQLNDVLKSLTVLDLSGGRITGVDYNSEAPLARRLATLRLALGERPTTAEFLGALRGAQLEVRSGNGPSLAGRLLSVERKTRTGAGPGWTVETDEISLITDGGEVRTVDLNSSTSVRIAEKDWQVEVGRYLGLIASSRDQDVRRMTISTTGTGERNLYVSYISEVPIWRTTYRIVLPLKAEKKPLLQGWAIVDNTVGEDWDGVELSLVAGAPHSFIQQLSEPFYGRRPVVPLPESVQLSPQTHAATLMRGNGRLSGMVTDPSGAAVAGATVRLLDENNSVVAQTTTESNGQYSFSGVSTGDYRVEVERGGFRKSVISALNITPGENQFNSQLQVGSATETVTVRAEELRLQTSSSMLAGAGKLSGVANRPHVGGGTGYGAGWIAPALPPPRAASLAEAREMGEEEKAPGEYRFRMEVPPKATASLPIEEVRTLATTYELSNLNEDQIGIFVKQGTITGEMAEGLKKITAQKAVVAKLEDEMENRQKDIDRIVEDQGRLRENMKALRGSAEEKALLLRYTKQLDEQETQLDTLRKKIRDTERQRDNENAQLEKMIDGLQIEATM